MMCKGVHYGGRMDLGRHYDVQRQCMDKGGDYDVDVNCGNYDVEIKGMKGKGGHYDVQIKKANG